MQDFITFLTPYLPIVTGVILATAILIYVLLDGFDLGVGILFRTLKTPTDKDTAMATIAPVWDGNETWLILGGGGFLALFPLAYATLFPAFYAPIWLMLIALIFRGVAFEYRHRDEAHQKFWDFGFWAGSVTAAMCQGMMLGGYIQGVNVVDRAYVGGWFDWLTPFTLLTGMAVVAGYALLGACWLVLKTSGSMQQQMYRTAAPLIQLLALNILVISVVTAFVHPQITARWFSLPMLYVLSPIPLLTGFLLLKLWQSVQRQQELAPYLYTGGVFVLGFIGLGASMFPYIVPYVYTLHDAANPASSQWFLLVGIVILLPVILGYTAYTYWLFRGKTKPEDGYLH